MEKRSGKGTGEMAPLGHWATIPGKHFLGPGQAEDTFGESPYTSLDGQTDKASQLLPVGGFFYALPASYTT